MRGTVHVVTKKLDSLCCTTEVIPLQFLSICMLPRHGHLVQECILRTASSAVSCSCSTATLSGDHMTAATQLTAAATSAACTNRVLLGNTTLLMETLCQRQSYLPMCRIVQHARLTACTLALQLPAYPGHTHLVNPQKSNPRWPQHHVMLLLPLLLAVVAGAAATACT